VRKRLFAAVLGAAALTAVAAEQGEKQPDLAAAFGARANVSDISLSPDGASIFRTARRCGILRASRSRYSCFTVRSTAMLDTLSLSAWPQR